ncbi:helix-turn-helix domain-containing protein [Paenibacillus residui]|uniref:Helix-turn-helix domain-containing protein n=1 Tax=Paenibacillus residui TaxID=629724 RepID=A0ABW3D752_9BACL
MFHPERLIEWRKKKKLTQEQLAIKVNTTKGTISNYENGHSTPPHETLVSIANILDVSTDFLLGRTNQPSEDTSKEEEEESDTEISMFFKDFKSAPKERQEEMLRFWKFIQEAEKDRKPGQRQDD